MAAKIPKLDLKEYEDDFSSICMKNMFGSLLAVARSEKGTQKRLVDNWWKIILEWYPQMHSQVYCVPAVHFNSVSFSCKLEKPLTPQENYGVRMLQPVQYSSVKNDEAQQRVLFTVSAFLRDRKSTAFVLSNMEFQNYLNKDYVVAGSNVPKYWKPNIKKKGEEGDVDVLIIDKEKGVFVLEVKAVGDKEAVRPLTEEKKWAELRAKFNSKIAEQIEKEKRVMRNMLSVLDPANEIKIRAGFVLPNIPRKLFEQALKMEPHDHTDQLLKALGMKTVDEIIASTLCSDDMPDSGQSKTSPEILQSVERVLTSLQDVDGESTPMSDGLYEHIVALFCGPPTTVKICTEKSMPRVRLNKETVRKGKEKETVTPDEVRTTAGAAREAGRKFSELVLLPIQIEILQWNEAFVHLEGPPGTGKTLVLLLRILIWLDEGHKVWVISFLPPSLSITHVLFEQVAVCHKRQDFCCEEFNAGLSVWSASVERCRRPKYAAAHDKSTKRKFGVCWKLKLPLRCPPTVQKALILVQPSLDGKNVCLFKRKRVLAHPAFPKAAAKVTDPLKEGVRGPHYQYPAEGLPVLFIAHGGHERAQEDIWYCGECGADLANYLKNVLKIGSGETIVSDVPLKYSDVMIVATQNAFQISIPIAGFMAAMMKENIQIVASTTRKEGDTALTDDNVILAVDMTSVHGLERAVIIVIPQVENLLPTLYPRYSLEGAPVEEAMEESACEDFAISADGKFEEDDDTDSQSEKSGDAEMTEKKADTSSIPGTGSTEEMQGVGITDSSVKEEEGENRSDDEDDGDDENNEVSESDDDTENDEESSENPEKMKNEDSLTYAHAYSEQQMSAALSSLREQCRKDIFYIGSRTVSQLILIHLGKGPPEPSSTDKTSL